MIEIRKLKLIDKFLMKCKLKLSSLCFVFLVLCIRYNSWRVDCIREADIFELFLVLFMMGFCVVFRLVNHRFLCYAWLCI